MKTEYILNYVSDIEENKTDAGLAHHMEDGLFAEFISYIAEPQNSQVPETLKEIQEKARLVLKTRQIDFPRWCADSI